jgi:hypothetical protein
MWFDCKIQLGEQGINSPNVLVLIEGYDEPIRIDRADVEYNIRHFTAERQWGTPADKPADCFQTGTGWVRCLRRSLSRHKRTLVSIPRVHELELVVSAPDSQLWDGDTVRRRVA